MSRWAPASGIVFVVLLAVSQFALPTAAPPDASDPPQQYAAFVLDHRNALLAQSYLSGLAIVFFVWFVGVLAAGIRAIGENALAAIAYGGGLLVAAVSALHTSIIAGLAWDRLSGASPGAVKALMLMTEFAFPFPLALLAAATALAILRSAAMPHWIGWYAAVATLLFLAGGATYARSGFFSPDGAFSIVFLVAFVVGVVIGSVAMMRTRPA